MEFEVIISNGNNFTVTDFTTKASEVCLHFKNRGYPESLHNKALDKVKGMDRQSLLKPNREPPPKNDTETFLVTTYNPSNPYFKKILDLQDHLIRENSQT